MADLDTGFRSVLTEEFFTWEQTDRFDKMSWLEHAPDDVADEEIAAISGVLPNELEALAKRYIAVAQIESDEAKAIKLFLVARRIRSIMSNTQ